MKSIAARTVAAAVSLTCSAAYGAERMSKQDYRAARTSIATEHNHAKAACKAFLGNARDVCMVDAKGRERVALAQLEAAYDPSQKATHDVSVAKAGAEYAAARERCEDKAGSGKDACRKAAKAHRVAGGNDAMEDKLDAEFAIAREKCDARAGVAKDQCIAGARARFGKS